jgi:hypothetical protein
MHEGRKKRYIIAASIAAAAISVALYFAADANPYKNSQAWNFDSYEVNSEPNDFLSMQTGSGEKAVWIIKADSSTASAPNVIAQLSTNNTESGYKILMMPEQGYSNFRTSVKFKIISGEKEQAAGLIFRLQDRNHYFVLVADALNDRFSLCRAEPDRLICTQDVNVSIETDQWYTITAHVAVQGIAGYLDEKLLIQRYDQHYMTGAIGLWAKGDSVIHFDDLKIDY